MCQANFSFRTASTHLALMGTWLTKIASERLRFIIQIRRSFTSSYMLIDILDDVFLQVLLNALLLPCSGLVGITEIPSWELGIYVFPSGLCPELLDNTNGCRYILVHKIHLQLKLYHCNTLLSTYIQQNNQKVEQNKFNNKIAFPFGDVTFPIFDVLFKTPNFQMGFPTFDVTGRYFRLGNSVFPYFQRPSNTTLVWL